MEEPSTSAGTVCNTLVDTASNTACTVNRPEGTAVDTVAGNRVRTVDTVGIAADTVDTVGKVRTVSKVRKVGTAVYTFVGTEDRAVDTVADMVVGNTVCTAVGSMARMAGNTEGTEGTEGNTVYKVVGSMEYTVVGISGSMEDRVADTVVGMGVGNTAVGNTVRMVVGSTVDMVDSTAYMVGSTVCTVVDTAGDTGNKYCKYNRVACKGTGSTSRRRLVRNRN